MNTTNLFVEILVIGTGITFGLVFLAMAVFGYDWLVLLSGSSPLVLGSILLPIVYVFGLVGDRVSDTVFDQLFKDSLQARYFGDKKEDFNCRRFLYLHDGRLADLLEYGRSRLRICRGWAVLSVWILLTYDLFLYRQDVPNEVLPSLVVGGNLFFMILAILCWFSWRKLTLADYRKVQEQSEFLARTNWGQQTLNLERSPFVLRPVLAVEESPGATEADPEDKPIGS